MKKRDYDWLKKYAADLSGKSILELGAGPGIDTKRLRALSTNVTETDLHANPSQNIAALDHSQPLPFPTAGFDVVIASLCLHYFDWAKTQSIAAELHRVLKPNGVLIGRVNSIADVHYGAKGYPEIEPHFYQVKNKTKRFFSGDNIQKLFEKGWTIDSVLETEIDRYDKVKTVFEFRVCKVR